MEPSHLFSAPPTSGGAEVRSQARDKRSQNQRLLLTPHGVALVGASCCHRLPVRGTAALWHQSADGVLLDLFAQWQKAKERYVSSSECSTDTCRPPTET